MYLSKLQEDSQTPVSATNTKPGLFLWISRMVATAGGCFSPIRIGACPRVGFRIGRNGAGYNPWSGSNGVLKGIAGPQRRLQTGT